MSLTLRSAVALGASALTACAANPQSPRAEVALDSEGAASNRAPPLEPQPAETAETAETAEPTPESSTTEDSIPHASCGGASLAWSEIVEACSCAPPRAGDQACQLKGGAEMAGLEVDLVPSEDSVQSGKDVILRLSVKNTGPQARPVWLDSSWSDELVVRTHQGTRIEPVANPNCATEFGMIGLSVPIAVELAPGGTITHELSWSATTPKRAPRKGGPAYSCHDVPGLALKPGQYTLAIDNPLFEAKGTVEAQLRVR